MMNLDKQKNGGGRGTYKIGYSKETKLAAFQWCDSKVVNCVSSFLDFRRVNVRRQVGSSKKKFECPAAMVHYQSNMGGVDKADQMRGHFGGFAAQSHFKKWYKKTVMAVLDCMLLNGLHLWNMSTQKIPGRRKLHRYEFLHAVSYELLTYKTPEVMSPTNQPNQPTPIPTAPPDSTGQTHDAHEVSDKRCKVCSLEIAAYKSQMKKLKVPVTADMKEKVSEARRGERRHVSICSHCGIHAHMSKPAKGERMIHKLFNGMTCMQVLHSKIGKEIWKVLPNGKVSVKYKHTAVSDLGKLVKDDLEG